MSITWTCDACETPVEDGRGYVCISPREAVRRLAELSIWRPGGSTRPPAVVPWRILHTTCDPDQEGPEYWWDVEKLRTAAGVDGFAAQVRCKTWATTATDLEAVVDAALARLAAHGNQNRGTLDNVIVVH